MSDLKTYTEEELLKDKPRGDLIFLDKDGRRYKTFVCHGCQTCWDVTPDDEMRLVEYYPHFYKMDPVNEPKDI